MDKENKGYFLHYIFDEDNQPLFCVNDLCYIAADNYGEPSMRDWVYRSLITQYAMCPEERINSVGVIFADECTCYKKFITIFDVPRIIVNPLVRLRISAQGIERERNRTNFISLNSEEAKPYLVTLQDMKISNIDHLIKWNAYQTELFKAKCLNGKQIYTHFHYLPSCYMEERKRTIYEESDDNWNHD